MISATKAFAELCKNEPVVLGRQMENNYRQIIFDCSGFSETITDITLVHKRSQDTAPYVVASSSTSPLTWTISDTDTAYYGYGNAELRITFSGGLAKSATFKTLVIKSITAAAEIPEPLQSWYDAMIEYIDENSISPEDLGQAIAEYLAEHPITAPVTSVNSKTGAVVLTASDVGALADDYVAPVQSVNSQTGAVTITAADLGALTSESDPVFSASAAAGITSADITAWNNKSNFSGSYNDLTNKPSIVNSFNGSSGAITYTAPVTSVNAKTGAVVLDADDVGAYTKPSGGIPKSDLASAVQTSLGLADTALQTAPVTSVNGQTGAVTVTDTNTTYTISLSGAVITLTPSSGVAQTITLAEATSSAAGLMSATDKTHLDAVYADYSSAINALGVE